MACSALEEKYRQVLEQGIPTSRIHFILLDGPRELIAKRLAARHHEFMNPNLLGSQLATLEPPVNGIRVVNDRPPDGVVEEILTRIVGEGAEHLRKSREDKNGKERGIDGTSVV